MIPVEKGRHLPREIPPAFLGLALGTIGLAPLWLDLMKVFAYDEMVRETQTLSPVILIAILGLSVMLIVLYCLKAVFYFELAKEDLSSADGINF
jgi:hypothetical protein